MLLTVIHHFIMIMLYPVGVTSCTETSQWQDLAPLPDNITDTDGARLIALNSQELLLAGGWANISVVYNTESNTWTTVNNPSTLQGYPAITLYNGKIIIMGGNDGSKHVDSVEQFDSDSKTWEKHTMTLPQPMIYCVAGVMDLPIGDR